MNLKSYIIIAILFLLYSASLIGIGTLLKTSHTKTDVLTVSEWYPLKDTLRITTQKIVPSTDHQSLNIDSLSQVINDYWRKFYQDAKIPVDFIAEADSQINTPYLKGKIWARQRIPFDPLLTFGYDLSVKHDSVIINNTEKYEPTLWSLGLGLVMHSQDSLRINLMGEISYSLLNYKNFEFPVTARIELDDNFKIVDKSLSIMAKIKL